MKTRLIKTALLGGVLAVATLAAAPAGVHAQGSDKKAAKPAGDTVRPEIGKPLQAAQELMKAKKFKEALGRIKEADAVADKTPYEAFVTEQMRLSAALQGGDLATAEKAFDAIAGSDRMPAEQKLQIMRAISVTHYQAKDYKRAVDWANRYLKAGGTDPAMRDVIKQAQFLAGDMAAAGKEIRAQIAAAEKAGKAPEKVDLELLANVGLKQNDQATYIEALEKLVRHYPTPAYWQDLIVRTQKQPGFARDRLALDVFRLMRAVGVMDQADDYMEAAQLALQATLPGEAKAIVEEGYAKGILGAGPEADRHKRLRDLAVKQAAEDRGTLDATAKEVGAAPTGGPAIRVGEAYASHGDYARAVPLIEQGLKKGGLKQPEDTRLRLATILLAAGRTAEAKSALAAVKGTDGTAALARLWLLKTGA